MKNIKTEGTLDTEYRQDIISLLFDPMTTAQLGYELGIDRVRLLKLLIQLEHDRQIIYRRGYWQLR